VKYSEERRQAVLAKLCPPHNRSIREVAAEEDISEATLYNWRKAARQRGELYPDAGSDAQGWSARDKFAAVIETAPMNASERSAYCRQRGLSACFTELRQSTSCRAPPRRGPATLVPAQPVGRKSGRFRPGLTETAKNSAKSGRRRSQIGARLWLGEAVDTA